MSASTRPMLGSIANPIIPPTIVKTPITTISSGRDHPLRSPVWSKMIASAISPVTTATADCTSWMKKLARYWTSFITPTRTWIQANLSPPPLMRSSAHRRVTHDCPLPHQRHAGRADADPHRLPDQPVDELLVGDRADERRDRETEARLERQVRRHGLYPVGHQRDRHQAPGQQQLGGEVGLEDRTDPC